MAQSTLAPHPPRMTVTAPGDVPMNRLRVPPGFRVERWAHGMPGARMMALGNQGTVFVGTGVIGRVYAVTDQGGQPSDRILADGLTQLNGIAFKDGALTVMANKQVLRWDGIEGVLANPGTPTDLMAASDLPPDQHHGWKFTAFGRTGVSTRISACPATSALSIVAATR